MKLKGRKKNFKWRFVGGGFAASKKQVCFDALKNLGRACGKGFF